MFLCTAIISRNVLRLYCYYTHQCIGVAVLINSRFCFLCNWYKDFSARGSIWCTFHKTCSWKRCFGTPLESTISNNIHNRVYSLALTKPVLLLSCYFFRIELSSHQESKFASLAQSSLLHCHQAWLPHALYSTCHHMESHSWTEKRLKNLIYREEYEVLG